MLQLIRDHAQGWIAWVIVGLIIIPFALWGFNEYIGGTAEIAAAKVNDKEISQGKLQDAYYRQRQRLQQMFGENLPEELFAEASMKKQLLQQLIEDELVLQSALSLKMSVGDDQLIATIQSIDPFKENGQFSNELYERVLRSQGMQPTTFEMRLRRDLTLQQYRDGIEGSEFVTHAEVELVTALNKQQRHISYITVPISQFSNSRSVSDDEIKSYYTTNQKRFQTPEMVSVSYIELKQDAIASEIEIDEAALQERYESQIINYKTPEERRARHILITDDDNDDEKAKRDAEALLAKINAGDSFEQLAKEHSGDPGSAAQGGDLGFFGRGLMDKSFEEAAYKLTVGEVSPVVKSEYGYHIIKLEEIRGGETKSFVEVKGNILAEIQQEQAEQAFYDQAELLANLTYEQPDTLQIAADELHLAIQQTPLFGKSGGSGITKSAKFAQAAFSEDVLQRGNNSAVIELSRNHLVVLRLDKHQPEGIKPLDTVKSTIEKQLLKDKAEQSTLNVAQALVEKINGGEQIESLATQERLELHTATIGREEKDIDPAIVTAVFKMAHPKPGESTVQLVKLGSGDQIIVELNNVESKMDGDLVADEKESNSLREAYAAAAYNSVVNQLRNEADISIKP